LIERSTLLKSGKVFEIADNEYQSVGSDYIDRTKYLFSLFDEQQKSNSLYEGKYVHDMKQGHVSYFLMADSIDTGELYLDSEFIAKTESKSLIDHENNIYYFKQNQNKRELFINKTKLTEFEGYFSILQDVVLKGTGKSAQVPGIEVAGKTGTTNDNVDAWFCGYSPSIQTIIWFGKDNNTPMRKTETGGKIAAPVFSYFYKKYLEIHPEIPRNFVIPQNVYTTKIHGRDEFYTDISPIPDVEILPETENKNSESMEF
jgi:membrane peptidoglycan carboxypeptidase